MTFLNRQLSWIRRDVGKLSKFQNPAGPSRIVDSRKSLSLLYRGTKLLVVYSLHLDTRSSPPDARWQDLVKTVREVMTNVLNVFALANEKLREDKREASPNEVQRFWNYAHIFSQGDESMVEKLQLTKRLVNEYRQFYQVKLSG